MVVKTFDELVNQYRELPDGLPPTALDELNGAFTAADSEKSEKIQNLTVENTRIAEENKLLKQQNYNYFLATQPPAPSADTQTPEAPKSKSLLVEEDK